MPVDVAVEVSVEVMSVIRVVEEEHMETEAILSMDMLVCPQFSLAV